MLKRRRKRKAQMARVTWQSRKSIMFVETPSGVVFGIHYHGKHAQLGARCAYQRIAQKHTAETLALATTVHGKPPQQRGWHHGITWQFLCDSWRQIVHGNAAGREGVVAGHAGTDQGPEIR